MAVEDTPKPTTYVVLQSMDKKELRTTADKVVGVLGLTEWRESWLQNQSDKMWQVTINANYY